MLSVTCTFCRAPINLNDGDLAQIREEIGDSRPKSYLVTCPNCRRGNKLPMDRLRRAYDLAGRPQPAAPEDAA